MKNLVAVFIIIFFLSLITGVSVLVILSNKPDDPPKPPPGPPSPTPPGPSPTPPGPSPSPSPKPSGPPSPPNTIGGTVRILPGAGHGWIVGADGGNYRFDSSTCKTPIAVGSKVYFKLEGVSPVSLKCASGGQLQPTYKSGKIRIVPSGGGRGWIIGDDGGNYPYTQSLACKAGDKVMYSFEGATVTPTCVTVEKYDLTGVY